MIILYEAWKDGLFKRKQWLPNIVAGIIVGVVALPLAMAFAIASGAKPEQGLYTAIFASLMVSSFGGSRIQIAGPTGAFIVILSGITTKYGIAGLQIATLMAGIMLVLFGLTKLGGIIKYIPMPVILGFTAGIGIIIFVGQWKDFFGLPAVSGGHFHEELWHLLQALPQLHLSTTFLAILSLLLVIFTPRVRFLHKIPGPLVAMLVATVLQSVFQFEGVATIKSAFGGIPHGLPELMLPTITMTDSIELIGPAFTIALLCAIESLLSAVIADGMTNTRHNSNQELIGQGLANIVAPLFGGFAATGAIARTATNFRNGGTGPLAGIIHAIFLVLILLVLAPLAANIPLCALSAILFVVAYNMSELSRLVYICRTAPRSEVAILLITLCLTVFADLVVAVNIGVILATLYFLKRMTSAVEVLQEDHEILSNEMRGENVTVPDDVIVYAVQGPFFFGAVETFERALATTSTNPRVLIIRLRWVPFIDVTGMQALQKVINSLQKRNIMVKLSGASALVHNRLHKAGIIDQIGRDNMFPDIKAALASC